MILGPDSIEVATTGGTSGTTAPRWNTTNEGATIDGTVTWTNEQDHFVVYAGAVAPPQTVYQWLTCDNCRDIASLDQFYANGAQSSHPMAYRVLGNQLNVSPPSNPITYSNQEKTVTSAGQSNMTKQTVKVTSIGSNSLSVSGGVDFGLQLAGGVLGIGLTGGGSHAWSTTTTDTTVDSQMLQSTVSATGQWAASTTIQDSGNEQSIPVNVLQDSIFMGVAVQDTNMHPGPSSGQTRPLVYDKSIPPELEGLPIVPVGHSPAILRKNGSTEPTTYVQQTNYEYVIVVKKPTNTSEIKAQLRALHTDAALRHITRSVPPPGPVMVSVPSPQDTLNILMGIRSQEQPVQDAIKRLNEQISSPNK